MIQGVAAWCGPPGSEPVNGPGSNQISVLDGQNIGSAVAVHEPREAVAVSCRGKLSDGTRCRVGIEPLCKEHLHL
jgi:hypothetical protein